MTARAKLSNYFRQRDRGLLLALLAAVCLVYLPFLGSPFFFDDLSFFSYGAARAYTSNGFDLSLRWLPYASLGRLYAVFSAELPHVYRLSNLLLHAANTILLFYFLRQLLAAVQVQSNASLNATRSAWLAALVFALHPVAAFAVGYAIQISILMATLFALLMQMAYLRGLLSGQKRWFALTVFAYFLACFSKEHSVLMPAVLLAMGMLVQSGNRVQRRVLWLTWAAFFAIAVLVTLRAKGVLGAAYEPMAAQLFEQQEIAASTPMMHLLSALTQAGLFFKYLLLWFFPLPALMSVDMRETFIASLSAWQGWLGGFGFMLYGAFAIGLLLRGGTRGLAGFALLYPWLLFFVEMTGIRVQEPFVLYRSYLWMPGMLLLFPLLLTWLSEGKAKLAIVSLAMVLVLLSWERLWVFSDNYSLWNEAASLLKNEQVAGAARIFYNRGQAEMAEKRWGEAVADLKRAADISPQLAPIHYLLGVAYSSSGRSEEALAQYDVAIALNPNEARAYFSKGLTLKHLHRNDEADEQMRRSCELKDHVACLIVQNVISPPQSAQIRK